MKTSTQLRQYRRNWVLFRLVFATMLVIAVGLTLNNKDGWGIIFLAALLVCIAAGVLDYHRDTLTLRTALERELLAMMTQARWDAEDELAQYDPALVMQIMAHLDRLGVPEDQDVS